ncbi:MAG: hypothetical protein K8R87_14225 [Verrucomicrobia bacterium]|nr:hypothetical protein [Verrucomicrobiota bacterium]
MMPRPVMILIILFAVGTGAGWWLSHREPPVVNPLPAVLRQVRREVDAAVEKSGAAPEMPAAAPASNPQTENETPDFGGIAVELVRMRELQALPLVAVKMPRQEVLPRITQWLSKQFPGDYGLREGRALAALGAIPQPVDTVALRAAFWSHQIGAWFDVTDETLSLVEQAEGDDAKENALGLAFAQLFREHGADLFQSDGKQMNSDVWLARLGLIAGDAAFTRLRHALAHPRSGGGGGVGEDPDDPSREIPLPAYLRERDLAAFGVGLDFVSSLHGLGKFEQVNAAYGRPPVATIELFEPSLYLADKQFKTEATGWKDVTVGGVEPFWDDTIGAIGLVLYLKQYLPQPIAADVVPGWRGDRLLVYPATKVQQRDHIAWQTFWQDSNAADAFYGAMRQALLNRYKNAKLDAAAPHGVFRLEGPDRFVVLTRTHDGLGVFLVDTADASFADAAWRKFTSNAESK